MKIQAIAQGAVFFLVVSCSSMNVGPPNLPKRFDAQGSLVYRLNTHSEFRHLESIVIGKTTSGFEGAFAKRGESWRYFRAAPEKWSELQRAMDRCRFEKLPPTAPPYALGGVGYSLERRGEDWGHGVFRINPDNEPGESQFMALVSTIRATAKAGEAERANAQSKQR